MEFEQARKRAKLTVKQRRFCNEVLADPKNLTNAARRAGYAEKSASTIAYRLMKHDTIREVLKHHFVDKQSAADELLVMSINWAKRTLDPDSDAEPRDKAKAAKWVNEYTRLAAGVLGLNVKAKPKPFEVKDEMTPSDMWKELKCEMGRIERLMTDEDVAAVRQETANDPIREAGEDATQH